MFCQELLPTCSCMYAFPPSKCSCSTYPMWSSRRVCAGTGVIRFVKAPISRQLANFTHLKDLLAPRPSAVQARRQHAVHTAMDSCAAPNNVPGTTTVDSCLLATLTAQLSSTVWGISPSASASAAGTAATVRVVHGPRASPAIDDASSVLPFSSQLQLGGLHPLSFSKNAVSLLLQSHLLCKAATKKEVRKPVMAIVLQRTRALN